MASGKVSVSSLYPVVFPTAYYRSKSRSEVEQALISIFGDSFVVFTVIDQPTDGTEAGWYVIWRNKMISANTRYIRLN